MGAIITTTTGCSGISIPRKIIPTWAFRACVTLVAAMLVTPVLSVVGQQTCIERDLQYRLDGDDLLWNNVRAVSTDDHNLFVLTLSSPRIHRFDLADGTHVRSWGQRGQGPGEFQSSSGITLVGEHVYALDSNQGRLSIFEFTGDLVRTVALREFGMPPNSAGWLGRAGDDTVLFGLSVPMGNERSIIARSFGASAGEDPIHQDTVIVFPARTATLRLTAPGAPSFTLPPPYSPVPRWTPFSGDVAYWSGLDSDIHILGFDGVLKSAISLALDDRFEVTPDDREFWLQNAIPQEFLGQRAFEPLREKARRTVDFPRYHPLLFAIFGGPDDLLWVRRTPNGQDQVWDLVDMQGQFVSRVSLASGQAIMSVIPDHLVLKITDELGVESIEVHRCRTLPTGGSP